MMGEVAYGNDDFSGHDVFASSNTPLSEDRLQTQLALNEEELKPLDINTSNSRFDKYLFYFSSRL
jgi:hypothetical protein